MDQQREKDMILFSMKITIMIFLLEETYKLINFVMCFEINPFVIKRPAKERRTLENDIARRTFSYAHHYFSYSNRI